VFEIKEHQATCVVSPSLAERYGGESGVRHQRVLSITNRELGQQTLYNEARTRKPQTFLEEGDVLGKLSDEKTRCDFCNWKEFTAECEWGRIEAPHAVSSV
jgi:hypothetical protein